MAGVTKPQDASEAPQAKPVAVQRVKAIPFFGGTTVIIRDTDFQKGNIEHDTVTWDYRIDEFTVRIGEGISKEAADYLVNNFPDSFKFV